MHDDDPDLLILFRHNNAQMAGQKVARAAIVSGHGGKFLGGGHSLKLRLVRIDARS